MPQRYFDGAARQERNDGGDQDGNHLGEGDPGDQQREGCQAEGHGDDRRRHGRHRRRDRQRQRDVPG